MILREFSDTTAPGMVAVQTITNLTRVQKRFAKTLTNLLILIVRVMVRNILIIIQN
jgi:hypothetical protein